jgi:predicted MFS family arabinose efflux permease
MFVTSAALLALFVPIEARAAQPLLPLHIVADRNRIGSYLAIGLAFCSMFGVFLFLTYYLQQNLHYSPLMTGAAFLPFAAGIATSAGVSNTQLVTRFGPGRWSPPEWRRPRQGCSGCVTSMNRRRMPATCWGR